MVLAKLLQENPIVVTGLGAHTAAGAGVDALWQAALQGTTTSAWLPKIRCGETTFAGCFAPTPNLSNTAQHLARKLDRCVLLGLAAADEAWQSAQFAPDTTPPARISVIVGTARGPVEKWNDSVAQTHTGRMRPTLAASSSLASLSGAIAMLCGARGPCLTVAAACASGAAAMGLAAQQILTGAADIVIAGGSDAPLNATVLAQLHAAGVLGSHAAPALICRPFDTLRNGLVVGEGAAFLILESLEFAKKRNAKIHARLAGWALGSEAQDRAGMSESGAGLENILQQALHVATLSPHEIAYVNAHGTGTRLNDLAEARALESVFGARAVPCSSTKPVTGHCLGASAAIEAVISICALRNQLIPPSANCPQLDPACAVDLVRHAPRAFTGRAVVSNSSGFWGNHGSLIFTA